VIRDRSEQCAARIAWEIDWEIELSDGTLPDAVQQQRAKWDLLLLDIEYRSEQLRQIKIYEPWRLWFTGIGSAAALLAAGGVIGGLIVKLLTP
jgi:hypothetical protein